MVNGEHVIRKVEIEFLSRFQDMRSLINFFCNFLSKIHWRVCSRKHAVVWRKWRCTWCSAAWNNWNATKYGSLWEAQVGATKLSSGGLILSSDELSKCCKKKVLRMLGSRLPVSQHVKNTPWRTFRKFNEGCNNLISIANKENREWGLQYRVKYLSHQKCAWIVIAIGLRLFTNTLGLYYLQNFN